MSDSDERVVTGAMLGAFLAFGVDVIVIVAALWYVDRLPGAVAGGVSAAILAGFALWVAVRWVRLRRSTAADAGESSTVSDPDDADPLVRLKRRYADGEISDEEFERRLDRLLDADSRAEHADGDDGRGQHDRAKGRNRRDEAVTERRRESE
ncbi:SHOCT domain-containing protein [Halobaculum sp. CBA1158]|uniref:SHOCT domain-containing protein n=1 Tax=Halobaculum sp. CBA1158 TaxID=2904243 RepID=UPI001F44D30A|nr:SHOCT domain-containing protein [Halobaculum sp. CBA1158]UIP00028.1 SHOCT domain-containing protein [Halobaculum sp. CBA1158]